MAFNTVENLAKVYLEKKNFKILKRNYRSKKRELDIVAIKNNVIHLVEVKSSFLGLDSYYRRNIKSYLGVVEFENLGMTISIDLLVYKDGSFLFYENLSSDILL